MLTPQVSVVLGILILIFGVIAGFSDVYISYRILHLSIASVYILLTPLVIYVHSKRFYTKGPLDWIAWMHFILFGFILFITVKMLKKWLPKRHYHYEEKSEETKHEHFDNHNVVTNNGKKYDLSSYFESRKDLLYYKKTLSILNDLSEHNDSLLDVGGWKGEFISKVNGFTDKTVIDLHKKPKNFPEDINFISSDFIKANINKKYDVVICMQVLEHIDNDIIHRFTQKLFEVGTIVLISVPYKWEKGACKYHIQDPVDENKLKSWTKKEPSKTWIIKEKKSKLSRLIALYS